MDFYTQVHLVASFSAIPLGAVILWRRKGDRLHKASGRTWTGLILISFISSLGIRDEYGNFTYIHLLTLWTFLALGIALTCIRMRAVKEFSPLAQALFKPVGGIPPATALLDRHRGFMLGSYAGLVLAGVLAVLLPGQDLHNLVFSLF